VINWSEVGRERVEEGGGLGRVLGGEGVGGMGWVRGEGGKREVVGCEGGRS